MIKKFLIILLPVCICVSSVSAADAEKNLFTGQDLHLTAYKMTVCTTCAADEKTVIFEDGFTMQVGDNQLSSDVAVVWLRPRRQEHLGAEFLEYGVEVYLEGNVSVYRGAGGKATDLRQVVVEQGQSLMSRFEVRGQVFATAEEQSTMTLAALESLRLYQRAAALVLPSTVGQHLIEAETAIRPVIEPGEETSVGGEEAVVEEKAADQPKVIRRPSRLRYPVHFAGLWERGLDVEITEEPDGTKAATIIGRFYLWQKADDKGNLLEFEADSAVLFYSSNGASDQNKAEETFSADSVNAVYLRGNIVMTEGVRTVRADEIYYDFANSRALAINAELRTFDEGRGLPIYLRAAELRQDSGEIFQAKGVVLTTSEFYIPQISMTASEMLLTDKTSMEQRAGIASNKRSFTGKLGDVEVKLGTSTIFKWPRMRTDFNRPDVPVRRIRVGSDSDLGTYLETEWFMTRLLGWEEDVGVDSALRLDYYSKRGPGAGVDLEYNRDDYFGDLVGYVISDRGEDDLGRVSSRKNIEPDQDLRGRFSFRHRHYLPYDWQVITEFSYLSDENFLESFYRNEFNTGKEQESLLYLKRLKDNWGFSFLTKFRVNDFETMTEELPTVEFHVKGQSFWEDRLTYYTDTRLSRLRDRVPSTGGTSDSETYYNFATTRHEVDMPLLFGTVKFVPFVAGTYGYEDKDAFDTALDGTAVSGEKDVFLGEAGVRASTMFWKDSKDYRSTLWDLNGMRHIITPHVEAITYSANDSGIDMRDVVNVGVSQRWQTHRGPSEKQRTVDWMRLDIDMTWVKDGANSATGAFETYGPSAFAWNDPSIPLFLRRHNNWYGMVRDTINADYSWRVSDTTAILSDMNYDTAAGIVQQFDIGVSRYVYPDMSYYLGSRYLRPVIVSVPADGIYEQGSNSFIAAVSYALSPRYTMSVSHEYNFDYGKSVRSDLTFIRRYHRLYYGLTFSVDESLDRQSVMLNVWPEGVKELAVGSRRYVGLVGPASY